MFRCRLTMACPLGADVDFVYRKKVNHHGNDAEPPSIEKYLRTTLMAKKLHGALLVPQKLKFHTIRLIRNHHTLKALSQSVVQKK